jgi:hypothetical protein
LTGTRRRPLHARGAGYAKIGAYKLSWVDAWDMAKRYQIARTRAPLRGGGFADAFRLSIVEFSCLGERHFDVTGYPYESGEDAFAADWERLARDAEAASDKLRNEIQSSASSLEGGGADAGSTTIRSSRSARR